jgi:hypothetical protein
VQREALCEKAVTASNSSSLDGIYPKESHTNTGIDPLFSSGDGMFFMAQREASVRDASQIYTPSYKLGTFTLRVRYHIQKLPV